MRPLQDKTEAESLSPSHLPVATCEGTGHPTSPEAQCAGRLARTRNVKVFLGLRALAWLHFPKAELPLLKGMSADGEVVLAERNRTRLQLSGEKLKTSDFTVYRYNVSY